jgi:hypothetical protein
MVEHDRLALAHRQGPQRLQQCHRLGRGGRDLRRWAETHQRPRLAPQVPAAIGRQVEGDPAHPRLGHVVVPQPRPADRGAGKRLLDYLFGLVEVAGDRQELAEEPPDRAGVERLEAFSAGHRPPKVADTIIHIHAARGCR